MRGAVVKIDYCITRWGIRTRPWLAAAGLLLVAGGWMAAWSATPSGPLPMVALLTTLFGMILLASASWVTNRRRANVAAPSPAAVIPSVGRILGQVLTNTDASIILCNRKGRVLWVNNGFTRLTGYTLDDVRGKHSTALLIGPDTDLSTLAEVEERLGRCMPYSGEILNYAKDGRPYQVSFEALPICNGRGRLKSVVAIGRDVTDRVHAEKSLREEQDRYRAIFEAATNSLVIYNREGEVIEANPAACQMYGYSREQLIGLSGRTIVHCDYHHLFAEFLRKVAAGKPFHAVSRDVRQDGTEVDVEVRGAGLVFQGEPAMLAVLTDITEQQRAQRELREYAEAMQAANHSLEEYSFAAQAASRAKSEFLANMSHEIRTPMTAILGFAEMLRNDGDLSKAPPSRIEAIDTVLRNGEHLLRLINDILDLSKIEAGRFGVDRSECSLLSLVSDVQDMVEIRARAKNLPFIVEFAGAIPETIQSDATRLRQILVNLIGNAVKFTDSGEVRLRIEHLDLPSRSLLEFAVVDTGVGIAAEKLDTVFQPFTQAEQHGGRRGGTGLGLTISRELARLLCGELSVESTLGHGSTFRLQVPTGPLEGIRQLVDPAKAAAERRIHAQNDVFDSASLQLQGRILLAEDGPDNQRLIDFILRRTGADVVIVEDGQQAIDRVESAREAGSPFNLILMDMQMPVLNGYEATRRLRRGGCTIPIVALTAHAMKGDRLKCLDAGCDDYATKPIQRPQLLRLVSHYLPARTSTHSAPTA